MNRQLRSGRIPGSAPVGHFYIQSDLGDRVLDVGELDPSGHPAVVINPMTVDHESQLWEFTVEGFVRNQATGMVLDVAGGEDTEASDLSFTSPGSTTTPTSCGPTTRTRVSFSRASAAGASWTCPGTRRRRAHR